MAATTKKTQRTIAKAVQLHRAGMSLRSIGAELQVANTTVRKWLQDVGLDPGKRTKGAAPRSKLAGKVKETMAAALSVAAEAGPTEGGIASVRARHAQFKKIVDELAPLAASGEINPQAVATFANLELRFANELAGLELAARPPEQIKPEDDPVNQTAAAQVTAKLEQLVADAEKRARCVHCGENPHQ